jgi:hypothetical protein
MKIDHGMHIGLHLVFFGKTGVTYVQAFIKMNKDKVKGELPSFSMLVMKCSDASPMLKYCAYHGKIMMSMLC